MKRRIKIFAGVGTHKLPFTRFMVGLEDLCKKNELNAGIFVQRGNTPFKSDCMETVDFLTEDEVAKKIAAADVVVVHAGAGYIIQALIQKKPLVVVPRMEKYHEHTDDHQSELARIFQKDGRCVAVMETDGLADGIKKALKFCPVVSREKEALISEVEKFLTALECQAK